MASSYTETRETLRLGQNDKKKKLEKVTIAWTAHTDGTFTTASVALSGYLIKVVTNPGSTAPTANYDITLTDPDGSDLDAAAGTLANRHTTATECVYPVGTSGAATPILLCGTYGVAIANNSVNAATGTIIFYLVDDL
jgi:hypothetical protein